MITMKITDNNLTDTEENICSECNNKYIKRTDFDISGKCDNCFKKEMDKLNKGKKSQ